jgi:hypothetical protein
MLDSNRGSPKASLLRSLNNSKERSSIRQYEIQMIAKGVAVEVEFVSAPAIVDGELELTAVVRTKCAMPEQNESLPRIIEQQTVIAMQQFAKEYFRQAIEVADRELILKERAGKEGKGIQRIGTRRYTFKTIIGPIVVKRIRIKHKADNSTETPSARVWGRPQQVMIMPGLRNGVCNLVVKQSFRGTVAQLEKQSGVPKLISKSSVANILYSEGDRLSTVQSQRAEKVFNSDNGAKRILGRAAGYLGEDFFEALWLNGEEITWETDADKLFQQIEWEPILSVESRPGQERNETDDTAKRGEAESKKCAPEIVIVQPAEVVVRGQPSAEKEWLIHYNAVVHSESRNYYCSAQTSAQLFYQVGSVLAALGVDTGAKKLLIISDGARWINNWATGCGIEQKEAILCWYHLTKHCRRLIGEAITNKEDRLIVRRAIFKYLWQGQTAEAIKYVRKLLEEVADGCSVVAIKSVAAIEALKRYLGTRQPQITNYQERKKNKQWIASTQLEKFNDWSVSARCKNQGQRWTSKGLTAIALIETARRNGELEQWQAGQGLASWASMIDQAA